LEVVNTIKIDVFISVAALAAPITHAQTLTIRPTATFLQGYRDRTAPQYIFSGIEPSVEPGTDIDGFTGVNLAALGHDPGEVLFLQTSGATRFAPSDDTPIGGLSSAIAVFSTSDEFLGRRNENRVVGAIDIPGHPEFVTPLTANDSRITDITEDFLVRDEGLALEIPAGANFLHFAVIDAFYSDNLPGSPQTRLTLANLSDPLSPQLPEPATLTTLLGAMGAVLLRRRG